MATHMTQTYLPWLIVVRKAGARSLGRLDDVFMAGTKAGTAPGLAFLEVES